MEYIFDLLIVFAFSSLAFCLYVFVNTWLNINNIRSEYLTDIVLDEINKRNLETINELERSLKAASIVYIDSKLNKINNELDNKIKQLIGEI